LIGVQTLDPQVGLLSNREVLDLLLEEQKAQVKEVSALKSERKKAEDLATNEAKKRRLPAWDETKEISRLLLPENVRSVQLQVSAHIFCKY